MNKRFVTVILSCLLPFALCSCAGASGTTGTTTEQPAAEEEVTYADQAFLESLKKGLMARWDLVDSSSIQEATEDYDEYLRDLVNCELPELSEYTNATFEDTKLQEKAITYINCLNDSLAALDYYSADYIKFSELWTEAYNRRSQLIPGFINDYDLTFPDQYKDNLADIMTNAKVVNEQDALDAEIQTLIDAADFQLDQEKSNEWTQIYSTVIENTTDKSFDYFQFQVNLLDADGVIIQSTYASVNNWQAGQKARFEVYAQDGTAALSVGKADYRVQ